MRRVILTGQCQAQSQAFGLVVASCGVSECTCGHSEGHTRVSRSGIAHIISHASHASHRRVFCSPREVDSQEGVLSSLGETKICNNENLFLCSFLFFSSLLSHHDGCWLRARLVCRKGPLLQVRCHRRRRHRHHHHRELFPRGWGGGVRCEGKVHQEFTKMRCRGKWQHGHLHVGSSGTVRASGQPTP